MKKLKKDADKPIYPEIEEAVIPPVNGSGDGIDSGNLLSEGDGREDSTDSRSADPVTYVTDCSGDNIEPTKEEKQLIEKDTTVDHENINTAESEKETDKVLPYNRFLLNPLTVSLT